MVVSESCEFWMLIGEFGQVTMDVVGVAAMSFQLNGHVLDAEIGGDRKSTRLNCSH